MRGPTCADHGVELGLGFAHCLGEGAAREDEGDECGGGSVCAGTEEVPSQTGEFVAGEVVLGGGGFEEGFHVGGW